MPQRVVVVFSAQWAFSIFELNTHTLSVAIAALSLPRQHAWTNTGADEGMWQARATLQVCWRGEASTQGKKKYRFFARGVHAVCGRIAGTGAD